MTDSEFEALMGEMDNCDSNDAEIINLRRLAEQLWHALTPEQKAQQTFKFDPEERF